MVIFITKDAFVIFNLNRVTFCLFQVLQHFIFSECLNSLSLSYKGSEIILPDRANVNVFAFIEYFVFFTQHKIYI